MKSGYLTTEFWATVAKVGTSLVVLLVTLGVVKTADAESIAAAVTAGVLGIGVVVSNAYTIATYIKGRVETKKNFEDNKLP